MRRTVLLALPLGLLLSLPAAAQHWNDSGPGRDLLSSTITDFDAFRERAPTAPSFSGRGSASADAGRGPIPLLDWVPPPAASATPPRGQRRSPPRRAVRRAAPPAERESVAMPARSTPQRQAAAVGGGDWERSLADRERELQRLRRILEDDRLRYQQDRQPQLQ